jgi:hypothetical protein
LVASAPFGSVLGISWGSVEQACLRGQPGKRAGLGSCLLERGIREAGIGLVRGRAVVERVSHPKLKSVRGLSDLRSRLWSGWLEGFEGVVVGSRVGSRGCPLRE